MNCLPRVKPVFALTLVSLAGLSVFAVAGASAAAPLKLEVLSSKADRVTGGDMLLGVTAHSAKAANGMIVRLNGQSVTRSLRDRPETPRTRVGVIKGLRNGTNWITAWTAGQKSASRLKVHNSSIQGPVFSGPHQNPYICTTQQLGLGPAQDSNCSAPTKVSWHYRANNNSFKPLSSPTDRPADLVQTTTRAGQTVDYVVRHEQGVINRAVYSFATLASGGEIANGWNGRFVYDYDGGCSTGHQQGQQSSGGLDHAALSRGFVVLGSSLNVFNTTCNDVLSAETTSMVKEYAIETLGKPDVWTLGQGGSGGSVQIQMIAQNYPGLLDGINPGASFPDNSSPDYPDCRLLEHYFNTHVEGQTLTNGQKRSITGMPQTNGGCGNLANGADVLRAQEGCIESVVPVSIIFNPITNPTGVRCTLWDNMVNIYGKDPSTGYARRSYDNTGVQYGLQALLQGNINVKRFLDLNEFIGGYDNNGNLQSSRSVADPEAVKITYETGRINQGAGGWSSVPVIDQRNYQDTDPTGNVHQSVNTYRLRERLDRLNGGHANHVMFRAAGGQNNQPMGAAATDILSNWLDAIAIDSSSRSLPQKVIYNKPANAVDACWIGGNRIDAEAAIGVDNICETTYPPHSLPANRAGRPLDSITAVCSLKPVNPADYGSPNEVQRARLATIFPEGVCDYSRPGPGETSVKGVNLSFGPAQRSTTTSRKLGLKLNRSRINKSRRGATIKLTASMRPCPAVTWQSVRFERKVKRGKRAVWRSIGSKIATGNKCQASIRLKRIKSATRLRARALPIDGYRRANSPIRAVTVKKSSPRR